MKGFVEVAKLAAMFKITPRILDLWIIKNNVCKVTENGRAVYISHRDAHACNAYLRSFANAEDGMTANQLMEKYQCTQRPISFWMRNNTDKCKYLHRGRIKSRIILNEYLQDFEKYLNEKYRVKRSVNETVYFYLILYDKNKIKTGSSWNPESRLRAYQQTYPDAKVIFQSPMRRGDEATVRETIMTGESRLTDGWKAGQEAYAVDSVASVVERAEKHFKEFDIPPPKEVLLNKKPSYSGLVHCKDHAKEAWTARMMIRGRYIPVATNCTTQEEAALNYDYHLRKFHPYGEFVSCTPWRANQYKVNFPDYDFTNFVPQKEVDYSTGEIIRWN